MQAFISEALGTLVLSIAVGGVAFLAMVALLQRDRAGATVRGVVAMVSAVLAAPVHYMGGALDEVAQRVRTRHRYLRSDPEPFTTRARAASRLLVVFAGLFIVAAGVATGVIAMVPKRHAVVEYNNARATLKDLGARLPQLRTETARLDTGWRRDSATLVDTHAEQLRLQRTAAETGRAAIRADFAGRGRLAREQLTGIIDDLDRTTARESNAAARFQRDVRDLLVSVRNLSSDQQVQLGFTPADSAHLMSYLDHWRAVMRSSRLLEGWPQPRMRAIVQPRHEQLTASIDTAETRQRAVTEAMPGLREAANWKQALFLLSVGLAIGKAFLVVWALGLLLEVLWLLWDVADNLRKVGGNSASDGGWPQRGRSVPAPSPGMPPPGQARTVSSV